MLSYSRNNFPDAKYEAFKAAKVGATFSGYQPSQLIKNYRRFKDHLCPLSFHIRPIDGDRVGPRNVGDF
jgi:hypothetical protein